jgi:hypothetical protein
LVAVTFNVKLFPASFCPVSVYVVPSGPVSADDDGDEDGDGTAAASAGLDDAAAADVGVTVLVTVAPAHPAAASNPHAPIASAPLRLILFIIVAP